MSLTVESIIKAKLHIGNLKKESNPKTRSFWLEHNAAPSIVFDPEKIKTQLELAHEKFLEAKKAKKEILVLCETPLFNTEIEKIAAKAGFHYMTQKIPSGFLTNFDTLITRIRSMNELQAFIETEAFHGLTKKEQLTIKRKLAKIEEVYKGVKDLKKTPDLIIVVDWATLVKFVDEVTKTKKDAIILVSSNFDRWIDESKLVTCNVYSHSALELALTTIFNG